MPSGTPNRSAALSAGRRWLPYFKYLAAVISLLGFGSLCFLGGALTMFQGGPVARNLDQGFSGAQQWLNDPPPPPDVPPNKVPLKVTLDRPGHTFDGFTLVTTSEGAEACLFNRNGEVVHHWTMPEVLWERTPGLNRPPGPRDALHWERCHLYSNGDLLALCASAGAPYGFGVVKLDKDSNLLWKREGTFHHTFEVSATGRIFLVAQRVLREPPPGLDSILIPADTDDLVILTPDGNVADRFPLLETILTSPYRDVLLSGGWLTAGTMPPGPLGLVPPALAGMGRGTSDPRDLLHTNSIRELPQGLARKFPLFKGGQLLLSLRSPSLLAVLDLPSKTIVWAARGPWQNQHDAHFLPSGNFLLFDNFGKSPGARVLEYDPATQAIPWCYGRTRATAFGAPFRGSCQRLPNGNTLLTQPTNRVFEITPGGEVVWQLAFDEKDVHPARNITGATRFSPAELPFLEGRAQVRGGPSRPQVE
jgi:hypothetical protein